MHRFNAKLTSYLPRTGSLGDGTAAYGTDAAAAIAIPCAIEELSKRRVPADAREQTDFDRRVHVPRRALDTAGVSEPKAGDRISVSVVQGSGAFTADVVHAVRPGGSDIWMLELKTRRDNP